MTVSRDSYSDVPSVDLALDVIDQALDAALRCRVELHQEREDGQINVKQYTAGLKAVRDVEDRLEPLRRELGAEHTRAWETRES